MIVARHRIVLRSSAIAVLAIMALFFTGAVANATDLSISVGAPGAVAVGDVVEVKAVLSLAGDPVEGAIVSLTNGASLAGFDGRLELDRQTTGPDGVAVFTYEQRASENGEMWVEYLGPEDSTLDPLVFTIGVQPGAEQQHRSEAGVSIPWLNGGWLVIVVIMLVWASIVYVAFQLVIVGHTPVGDERGDIVSAGLRSEDGTAAIAVLLAAASVITAVGMVIVFVRNPVTHSNLDEPAGYSRTPIAHIDDEFSYPGPGLADPTIAESSDLFEDGRLTYFQFGCAGCHGLTGDGGAVAPALLDEVDSESRFAADVREGPENMPGYPEGLLSDEELARIFAFLSGEVTGD